MSGGIQVFSIFFTTLIPTLFLIVLYIKNKIYGIHTAIIPLIYFSFFYLIYAVFIADNIEDIQFVFFRSVRFVMATLFLNFIYLNRINFIDELNTVLRWVTIHGLINFVFVNLFFQYCTKIPDTNSYSFFVFFGTEKLGDTFSRSQGIFWEPGVFQVYLNIILFINLFLKKNINVRLVTIILISIFVTLSTTGIVVSFLLLSYYFLMSMRLTLRNLLFIFLLTPFLIVFFNFTMFQVEEKLVGEKSGSFLARNYDTVTGFNLAMENPWGIGFSTVKYQNIARLDLFNVQPGLETDRANTNSIATLFYSTGIIWGFVFLFCMYKQKLFMKHKLLFFISIVMFLFNEPLLYTPFFIMILLTGVIPVKRQLQW
jgi:hypothetical protein